MVVPAIPICEACTRLGPAPNGEGFACEAFPLGIPEAIYPGGFDHREQYDGDGGVRFELADGREDALAAFMASHRLPSDD